MQELRTCSERKNDELEAGEDVFYSNTESDCDDRLVAVDHFSRLLSYHCNRAPRERKNLWPL